MVRWSVSGSSARQDDGETGVSPKDRIPIIRLFPDTRVGALAISVPGPRPVSGTLWACASDVHHVDRGQTRVQEDECTCRWQV